jgi:hypothetical protein
MKQQLIVLSAIVAGAMAMSAAPAQAGCTDGAQQLRPAAFRSVELPLPARAGFVRTAYVRVGDHEQDAEVHKGANAAIVGLWKVSFVAKGNPAGPPDGTVLDNAYAAWHSDGTEIMNSGRPPQSQSFCMGVWKQVGPSTFRLNHYALSWSPDGSTFVGPANVREEVTVDRSGSRYQGTFSIVQYDATEANVLARVVGTITGTRVGVD